MSIRARLVGICLVVALLPAVPLTFLVQSLLDKSFSVGLNQTVEEGLQSGLAISRVHYEMLREIFQQDIESLVDTLEANADSSAIASRFVRRRGMGMITSRPRSPADSVVGTPGIYRGHPTYDGLASTADDIIRRASIRDLSLTFYEASNRTLQFAMWAPPGGSGALFFRQTSPEFVLEARQLLEGRQLFAQLRVTRGDLSRSFFYPFVVIYGLSVALALALAMLMAERISAPIRRLVIGSHKVADGDWSVRFNSSAGGETGQLVDAFNKMVGRLEQQRQRLVDMEKMAAWRDVARHLAHEIKNPLLPIRLTVDELSDQYKGDDVRYRELLTESTRVIAEELTHLQQLVKEFSSFARMPELEPQTASLGQLLRDVAALYPQAQVSIDEYGETTFIFDPNQMRRVLLNLFDNSVGMTPNGEGPVIKCELSRQSDTVVLRFKDSGPGIPSDNIGRIFEPYFTTRGDGTGLGLAMSKNIVLMHGGNIGVESKVGFGTTFVVTLPLSAAHEKET